MTCIWLFLLGWARVLTGHFTPIEIAMTLVVGIACAIGLGVCFRMPTTVSRGRALGAAAVLGLLQLIALRVSLIPYIASH